MKEWRIVKERQSGVALDASFQWVEARGAKMQREAFMFLLVKVLLREEQYLES
jgi:hypothetical protein